MQLLKVAHRDADDIDQLFYQQDFRVSPANIIDHSIIIENGRIIAYGAIKKFAELVLVVDQRIPLITRSKAMNELMLDAIYSANRNRLEQIHATISDPRLERAIIRHFGFKRVPDAVLVKNVG